MREIVGRLQENHQVELAKSILESKGYKVSKRKLRESHEFSESIRAENIMSGPEYKRFLLDAEGVDKSYIKELQRLGIFSTTTRIYDDVMFLEDYEEGSEIPVSGEFNNILYNITLDDGTPAILDTNQDGYDCCYIKGE